MMLVCHVIVNGQRWTSVTQELLLGSLPHQSQVSDKVTYAVRINHKPYKFKGKYFNGTTKQMNVPAAHMRVIYEKI